MQITKMTNKIRITPNKLLFLTLLLESIALFLFAPHVYNFGFNAACATQFIVSFVIYIIILKKKNYFDFDMIFLPVYFLIMFFFPIFMYGTDLEKIFFAFQYDYNHNVISRATALSLVGAQAYMLGSLLVNSDRIKRKAKAPINSKVIPTGILTIGALVCFSLFIVAAGPELFTAKYDGGIGGDSASGALTYVMLLFGVILCSAFVIEFNNWSIDHNHQKNLWLFIIYIVYAGIMFLVGSRTSPVQFGLLIIGLYGLKIRPIKCKTMLIMVVLGIVAMGFISLTRGQNEIEKQKLQEQAGALVLLQDLILNNRNTYMAVDMVDKDGIDYGLGMMTNILGIVPFANYFVLNNTTLTEIDMSSGLRITAKSLGTTKDFSVGFGTNIIADIYMSFGLVGVIVLMLLLGYMVRYSMLAAIYEQNIYYTLLYAILMSYAVFIVRAPLLVFIRYFLWGLIIINITKLHPVKLKFSLLKSTK